MKKYGKIGVFSKIQAQYLNALCGQGVELFNVEPTGT
jgi:hypothetical protein